MGEDALDRDRGGQGRSPPTPPGMRVRIGRFEQLRLREARHAKGIQVSNRQHVMYRRQAVVPTPTA